MCAFYSTKVAIKWETDVRYGQIFGIGRRATASNYGRGKDFTKVIL